MAWGEKYALPSGVVPSPSEEEEEEEEEEDEEEPPEDGFGGVEVSMARSAEVVGEETKDEYGEAMRMVGVLAGAEEATTRPLDVMATPGFSDKMRLEPWRGLSCSLGRTSKVRGMLGAGGEEVGRGRGREAEDVVRVRESARSMMSPRGSMRMAFVAEPVSASSVMTTEGPFMDEVMMIKRRSRPDLPFSVTRAFSAPHDRFMDEKSASSVCESSGML